MGLTEQEKREKTIKGLECLTHQNFAIYKDDCKKRQCQYLKTDCEIAVMEDALELINAQIPCEDAVSREELLRYLADVGYAYSPNDTDPHDMQERKRAICTGLDIAWKAVKEAPSVALKAQEPETVTNPAPSDDSIDWATIMRRYTPEQVGNVMEAKAPRLLTLKQVLALEYDTPIYIEDHGGLHGWDIYSGTTEDEKKEIVTGASWAVAEYWEPKNYNVTWRCWTSKPSKEQMEGVKWDG